MANIKTITDIHGNTYDIVDAGAQRTLVSGTNIKTVNNQSLLGSGNITLPTYTAGTGIDITNGVISINLSNAEGSNY